MPLPNGEPALANDVTLKAELTLVARASDRGIRCASSRSAVRSASGSYNTALLRALREEAPCGHRDRALGRARRRSRRTTRTTTSCPGPSRSRRSASSCARSDAVFFATPEYNSSVPGALKNALDWASRPLATNAFRNKPVAVISSSAGAFGGVWAAPSCARCSARWAPASPRPSCPSATRHEKFDDDGRLVDDEVRQGLRDALQTLVAEVPSALAA